jgi:DMSO/TMAO reductase YedYZ molybdopterin-dependent catalytic subunit
MPRKASARRTNVGLLALLPLAFVTGWLAFGFGTPLPAAIVVTAHGLAGLGVLVLSPWKSVIVRRGLRRVRPDRWASIGLAVLVVVVVGTGLAHAAGLTGPLLGVTTMQVHVGAALLALPMAALHVLHRPSRPRRTDLSRRSLLRAGGVVGITGVVWGAAELAVAADRRFTGSHERGSGDPLAMPVTQWLFDPVPRLDPAAWRLRVAGTELTLADLAPVESVRATLDCTGGWYAEQDWSGVRLDRLLPPLPANARSVVVRSATGYTRRFPVADLGHLWLATAIAGRPLSPGHGAPARLVAPGRRGFWWVKWVTAIDPSDLPAWRQPPFPLQ